MSNTKVYEVTFSDWQAVPHISQADGLLGRTETETVKK